MCSPFSEARSSPSSLASSPEGPSFAFGRLSVPCYVPKTLSSSEMVCSWMWRAHALGLQWCAACRCKRSTRSSEQSFCYCNRVGSLMLTSYSGYYRWGCRRTFGLTRSGLTSQSSVGVCSKRLSVFSEGFNEISPVDPLPGAPRAELAPPASEVGGAPPTPASGPLHHVELPSELPSLCLDAPLPTNLGLRRLVAADLEAVHWAGVASPSSGKPLLMPAVIVPSLGTRSTWRHLEACLVRVLHTRRSPVPRKVVWRAHGHFLKRVARPAFGRFATWSPPSLRVGAGRRS